MYYIKFVEGQVFLDNSPVIDQTHCCSKVTADWSFLNQWLWFIKLFYLGKHSHRVSNFFQQSVRGTARTIIKTWPMLLSQRHCYLQQTASYSDRWLTLLSLMPVIYLFFDTFPLMDSVHLRCCGDDLDLFPSELVVLVLTYHWWYFHYPHVHKSGHIIAHTVVY